MTIKAASGKVFRYQLIFEDSAPGYGFNESTTFYRLIDNTTNIVILEHVTLETLRNYLAKQ